MVDLLLPRCTITIGHNTVINWVKQAGDSLPHAPPAELIPELAQLDELKTFVGSKQTSNGCGEL